MENLGLNVLVTGANGFIGSNLIPLLINKVKKVVILKRRKSDISNLNQVMKSVKLKFYNIEDIYFHQIMKKEKIDAVIHLATYYAKSHKAEDIEEMIYSNINFPTKILEAMDKTNVSYFVNTGTFFEYDLEKKKKLNEASATNPYNLYASTKLAFEEILKYYVMKKRISAITLRLFAPYGVYDKFSKVIPLIIKGALNGKGVELHSSGFQEWDYIYSEDIANAFINTLQLITQQKIKYELFNIGSGKAISLRELVRIVEEITNKKLNIRWSGDSKHEIKYACADIERARKVLKWNPKTTLKKGLEKTINWMKNCMKNEEGERNRYEASGN